jgi:hypothetical protein
MSIIFIISGIILFIIVYLLITQTPQKLQSIAVLPNSFIIPGIIILIACSIAPAIFNINENSVNSEIRNLFILIGLVILCLSKEKRETESLNGLRFITLISSLIVVSFIYQTFLILNIFKLKESTGSQLTICTLAIYLFVFHVNKMRLDKK